MSININGINVTGRIKAPNPIPNYATWDPENKYSAVVLSNSNLTATTAISNWAPVMSNIGSTIPFYIEYAISSNIAMIGFVDSTFNTSLLDAYPGAGTHVLGGSVYTLSGTGYGGIGTVLGGSTLGGFGTYMFAIDPVAKKAWFGKNGTWALGNPAAGTSPSGTWTVNVSTIYPCVSVYLGGIATANFGASAFTYSVPSGFNPGISG